MGSAEATFLVLWPTVFVSMSYLGIMAVSFQLITPNEMRRQTTAIYIFVTNMGMAVGTSVLAAFTDFFFQDDLALPYSIAAVNAIFLPSSGTTVLVLPARLSHQSCRSGKLKL